MTRSSYGLAVFQDQWFVKIIISLKPHFKGYTIAETSTPIGGTMLVEL